MKIIGIMTGNSMDACDIVLTEFDGTKITDLCPLTVPFSNDMRDKMDFLRHQINDEKISMADLERLPEFNAIHDEYVKQVADCVNRLVMENHLNTKEIDAIGFHGKTLDHCPPSVARKKNIAPYTLQIGSGQMLADLTGIPVIYDFRSDDLINGGEAAPLAPPHNNNIALCYGLTDAIFYNAGNTSNLSVISGGQAVQGWDAGPFNEFIDKLVRTYTKDVCDLDGKYGKKGQLKTDLLDTLFNNSAITPSGENFYLLPPPRSGDPAFYRYQEIKEFQNPENLNDVIRTAEYFSAYLAVYTLKFITDKIQMPSNFILFGGGWHNPVCMDDFNALLKGEGYVLPQHKEDFKQIVGRFKEEPKTHISDLGTYMEARIFADTARYYLQEKTWTTPELTGCTRSVVLGTMRRPHEGLVNDKINRAAKGWQEKQRD